MPRRTKIRTLCTYWINNTSAEEAVTDLSLACNLARVTRMEQCLRGLTSNGILPGFVVHVSPLCVHLRGTSRPTPALESQCQFACSSSLTRNDSAVLPDRASNAPNNKYMLLPNNYLTLSPAIGQICAIYERTAVSDGATCDEPWEAARSHCSPRSCARQALRAGVQTFFLAWAEIKVD